MVRSKVSEKWSHEGVVPGPLRENPGPSEEEGRAAIEAVTCPLGGHAAGVGKEGNFVLPLIRL